MMLSFIAFMTFDYYDANNYVKIRPAAAKIFLVFCFIKLVLTLETLLVLFTQKYLLLVLGEQLNCFVFLNSLTGSQTALCCREVEDAGKEGCGDIFHHVICESRLRIN